MKISHFGALAAMGQTVTGLLFDPHNMNFNSGGVRGMTWGNFLIGGWQDLVADNPLGRGNAILLSQGPSGFEPGFGPILFDDHNGRIGVAQNVSNIPTGIYLTTPPCITYSGGSDEWGTVRYYVQGDSQPLTVSAPNPYGGSSAGATGTLLAQFVTVLNSLGICTFPDTVLQSSDNYINFILSNPTLTSYAQQGYIWLNNQSYNRADNLGWIVVGITVLGVAAIAYEAAAAAAAASAAGTSAAATTATAAGAAADPSSIGVSDLLSAAPTGSPSDLTSLIGGGGGGAAGGATTAVADTTGIATGAVTTGEATAAGTSVEAAAGTVASAASTGGGIVSDVAGLLTKGAGLVAAAAPTLAKLFGTSALATPATLTPDQIAALQAQQAAASRNKLLLFAGAGILLFAIATKGKKGGSNEPRTDFVR